MLSALLRKYLRILFIFAIASGCSATDKLIKHGKLQVETRMSDTIFLDPLDNNNKTVLLQIRNTSGKSGLNIEPGIRAEIESKGYKIVKNPKKAHIMIQVNILQVGRAADRDPFELMTGGYGSALGGFATGAVISGAMGGSSSSMLGTGLLVGAASSIIDSAVEVINYSMITDVQISEKTEGDYVTESSNASLRQGKNEFKSTWNQKTNWKKYQTRIISVARKVNLKFEEAKPKLTDGLVESISGIL